MPNRSLKIPVIILAIGLVLCLVAALLTGIVKAPAITQQDFDFTVTYQLDGETNTLAGVYRCQLQDSNPRDRYYTGTHLTNPTEFHPAAYTIAQKDDLELCIVVIFSDRYLMGDADGISVHADPYLAVMDSEGMEYDDTEHLSQFDAEILDWEYPAPVENALEFAGFSKLHTGSMLAMLVVGLLVILACVIFVKRDKTIPYKMLAKVSVVLNYVIACIGIPFATLVVWLMQIFADSSRWSYQVCLCVPALSAFAVAASIALRRSGFTKIGFFIQFVGPVLFALLMIL